MIAVPVLSSAVSLLTPVGPRLFPAVLQVTSRAKYFHEWGPPDFTDVNCLALLGLLALAIVPRVRRGPVSWFDVCLIGLAALWAVYSTRTVPVAACMLAPLAAAALQPKPAACPPVQRTERLLVLGGYVVALAVLAIVVPHTADQPRATPSWLDGAVGDLPEGTKVVNNWAFGGYLMWRFPQLDQVMYGYGDNYTDDELERNADIDAVRGGWLELLRATDVDYAVLPPSSPLAYNLRDVEGWTVLQHSDDLELLRPPPGWKDGS
jgi:hypothetical protein